MERAFERRKQIDPFATVRRCHGARSLRADCVHGTIGFVRHTANQEVDLIFSHSNNLPWHQTNHYYYQWTEGVAERGRVAAAKY